MQYTIAELRTIVTHTNLRMAEQLDLYNMDYRMPALIPAQVLESLRLGIEYGIVQEIPNRLCQATPVAIAPAEREEPVVVVMESTTPPFAGGITAAPVDQDNTVMALTLPEPIVEPSPNGQHEPIAEEITTPRLATPSAAADASAKRKAELTEVLDCLRSLAVDGVMPAQTLYDERKPDHLLPSKLLANRFGVLWQELAEQAGLRYSGRGPALTGKRK